MPFAIIPLISNRLDTVIYQQFLQVLPEGNHPFLNEKNKYPLIN